MAFKEVVRGELLMSKVMLFEALSLPFGRFKQANNGANSSKGIQPT